MSHLMPERRMNKNGFTSTKWVKPSQNIPQNTKIMPPPPGTHMESLPSKKDKLRAAIDLGTMRGDKTMETMLFRQINKMSESSIDLAIKTLAVHPGRRVNTAVRICIDEWNKDHKRTEEGLVVALKFAAVESVYDNYLKTPLFGTPHKWQEIMAGVTSSFSVRDEDRHLSYDLRQLNDDEMNEVLMAGHVAAMVETHLADFNKDRSVTENYRLVFQEHSELVGVFAEYCDRLDEVLHYVYENGPDAGALRQHMRGDHMALAGGAL